MQVQSNHPEASPQRRVSTPPNLTGAKLLSLRLPVDRILLSGDEPYLPFNAFEAAVGTGESKYQLGAPIGKGGISDVYAVTDKKSNNQLVAKIPVSVLGQYKDISGVLIGHAVQEARLLANWAKDDIPGIPKRVDMQAVDVGGHLLPAVVIERGKRSLDEAIAELKSQGVPLKERLLKVGEMVEDLGQCLVALDQYAANHGLPEFILGDIKPANVMECEHQPTTSPSLAAPAPGKYMLIDFGGIIGKYKKDNPSELIDSKHTPREPGVFSARSIN